MVTFLYHRNRAHPETENLQVPKEAVIVQETRPLLKCSLCIWCSFCILRFPKPSPDFDTSLSFLIKTGNSSSKTDKGLIEFLQCCCMHVPSECITLQSLVLWWVVQHIVDSPNQSNPWLVVLFFLIFWGANSPEDETLKRCFFRADIAPRGLSCEILRCL